MRWFRRDAPAPANALFAAKQAHEDACDEHQRRWDAFLASSALVKTTGTALAEAKRRVIEAAIRASNKSGRTLAREYGVGQPQIARIKSGARWAEGIAK